MPPAGRYSNQRRPFVIIIPDPALIENPVVPIAIYTKQCRRPPHEFADYHIIV